MCGIAGYAGVERDEHLLQRMTRVMAHRGPDDEGFYYHGSVGLGNRRLAIIDLSESGHQPMCNEDSTIWITYNGEIYNYLELVEELKRKGHVFRSHCDTEAIIHSYEEWGPACLDRFNGMFAFAIYNQTSGDLFLARDRLGIRPLYYWRNGTRLLFASEMKAILEADVVERSPNLQAVAEYLALRYVPGPECIIQGVHKLPSGHYAIYKDGEFHLKCYWKPKVYQGPYSKDEYYFERFADLLEKAVQRRLVSDVPFGAYLSGGLDSSVIVALMSRALNGPVKTFSVGFDSPKDELPQAQMVASHLGSDHHQIICRPADMALLPKIVWHLDEPQGDAIVLPTYLLSREASKEVKMVLTGEGADETMAGYQFHQVMYRSLFYSSLMPRFLHRYLVVPVLRALPATLFNKGFSHPGNLDEKGKQKILSYATHVLDSSLEDKYRASISLFGPADIESLASDLRYDKVNAASATPSRGRMLEQILHLQFASWLPDNILWRQDRMTMANSIEGRVPFLDHELVEFLLQVPPHLKLRGLTEKYLLRQFGRSILPRETTRRKKQPFYIPLEKYMGQPQFKALLDRTLTPHAVKRRGLFRWEAIEALVKKIDHRDFLYAKQVFALITLELWFQIFVDREEVPLDAT